MIWGLKRVVRYALGTDIAGRNLAVRPDDTFIVSYPKSGNTWTRFLVANLVHPETPATFGNIEDLIPDSMAVSKRRMTRMPGPRIIKSHDYFNPSWPRVIYIVRDPRDVALSQFHFHRKRKMIGDDYQPEKFVTRFIAGETVWPFTYGTWGDNVGSWLAPRYGRPGFRCCVMKIWSLTQNENWPEWLLF